MTRPTTVIVGASVGGVRTAQALRAANYPGRIVLVEAESGLPYDKPPLSKAFLAGTAAERDLALLSREDADELDIELRLGCQATALHLSDNAVQLHDGASVCFDNLVIATGARARPSPWGQPDGLHVLRTLEDSRRLRADLAQGGRLVVVGGGFIGAEIAATARSLNLSVTIVDPSPVPMERVLGRQLGERFLALHQRNGVRTLFQVGVEAITGHRRDFQVHLTTGDIIEADYVVVGIGALPNDDWLLPSGLHVDSGVVCDEHLRARDAPHVYALGDVCRWHNPRHDCLTRVEHWTTAVEQAGIVAHNITHPDDLISCAPIDYVWSDQFQWAIRVAGRTNLAEDGHVEVVGENDATGRFAALYSSDGEQFSGIVVVNWPRALIAARRALAQHASLAAIRATLEELASK